MDKSPLPVLPVKRYFTIGEVSVLCNVKPYVLRYWEQEFAQLRPMKRRGNRRYYQHHEVLLIRRIRELLYDHGFTIHGARNQLSSADTAPDSTPPMRADGATSTDAPQRGLLGPPIPLQHVPPLASSHWPQPTLQATTWLRAELTLIRDLLVG